jgi:predicted AlkP superfamily pyrophosphatase or phosphodiesterase
MMILLRNAAALLGALLISACAGLAPSVRPPAPPVILISIDGFRPDYLDRGETPTLSALAAGGALAAMRPSFPSKTFPNHYALVTGLRPDRNGIVDNTMTDPAIPGVVFAMSNAEAVADRRWWDEAEPIWVGAEKQGVRTGVMHWPGAGAAIRGVRPAFWRTYDKTFSGEARVDAVFGWLDLPPSQRPRFVALYFEDVDTAGHQSGPNGAELDAAVRRVDGLVGRLTAGLTARGIAADIVVVSDHGMAEVAPERRIFVDDLLPAEAYRSVTMGAFWSLAAAPGHEAEVERALIDGAHPHMSCWRKAEIPARFHYGANPRVPPFFCLPETGWEVTSRAWAAGHPNPSRGDHGFDPFDPQMRAVFIAAGPDVRAGARPAAFDNVDVYPLLARLLGVKPQAGDGDLAPLAGVLADRAR